MVPFISINVDGRTLNLTNRGMNQKGDKAIYKYEDKANGEYFTKYVPLAQVAAPVQAIAPTVRKQANTVKPTPTKAPTKRLKAAPQTVAQVEATIAAPKPKLDKDALLDKLLSSPKFLALLSE